MALLSVDNFTRANQSGWGTASGGGVWAATGTDTPAIVSNAGKVTATSGAHVELLYLGSSTIQDAYVKAKFQGNNTAHDYAVIVRGNGGNTYYTAEMNGGSLEILKVVGGVVTSLGAISVAFTANTNYWIKVQASGVSPTTLSASFWKDGTSEPAFQLTLTDGTAGGNLQTAGQFGIRTKLGATDTALFTSFEVDTLGVTLTVPTTIALQSTTTLTVPTTIALSGAVTTTTLTVPTSIALSGIIDVSALRSLINARIDFMSPSLIRTAAASVSWWCPSGVAGTYDFTTAYMQEWYAVFDHAQAQGISVIVAVNSTSPFALLSSDWATAFADLISYLINTLGYTCIDFVSGLSEPDTNGASYSDYKNTIEPHLVAALTANGLFAGGAVRLIGPDTTSDESAQSLDGAGLYGVGLYGSGGTSGVTGTDTWLTSAASDLRGSLSGYVRHSFPGATDAISGGTLEASVTALVAGIAAADPANKPVLQGEMAVGALGPGVGVTSYQYGLEMADYAVQLARAGMSALIGYLLDDQMHGTQWGLWDILAGPSSATYGAGGYGIGLYGLGDSAAGPGNPRPWFFVWSLLCQSLPAGSTIYAPRQPDTGDFRVLAALTPIGAWTLVLVNRAASARNVTLAIPGASLLPVSLAQYVYSTSSPPLVDTSGFPMASGTLAAVLPRGFTVSMAAGSALILTQATAVTATIYDVPQPPLQKRR